MEDEAYSKLRAISSGLFKNALLIPVANEVLGIPENGSFTASDLRQQLGGRVENNQIRDALSRLEACGAIIELPFPGRPHAHTWEREEHPFWTFASDWIRQVAPARALE